MWEFIEKGGPFLWPIIFFSVVALAIIIERYIYFARLKSKFEILIAKIGSVIKSGEINHAKSLCQQSQHPISRYFYKLCTVWNQPYEVQEKVLTVAGGKALRTFEQNLRLLGMIAKLAPLLGLLGTVAGLVIAFMSIASTNGSAIDAALLARGIWQALLTTVAGLLVAIPTHFFHDYFEGRVDRMAFRLEEVTTELLALKWGSKKLTVNSKNVRELNRDSISKSQIKQGYA